MWIKTFDEGGTIQLGKEKETKWNPPLLKLRCLGYNYLTVRQATKLRDYINKFLDKHKITD